MTEYAQTSILPVQTQHTNNIVVVGVKDSFRDDAACSNVAEVIVVIIGFTDPAHRVAA
ncbi:MAG: hypothetical protein QM652_07280 [Legionella sp.]|uniref:hypothetical protein n=1 Tax=Legionella sp. TaxID=459 RepID=UPI0039E6FDF8